MEALIKKKDAMVRTIHPEEKKEVAKSAADADELKKQQVSIKRSSKPNYLLRLL